MSADDVEEEAERLKDAHGEAMDATDEFLSDQDYDGMADNIEEERSAYKNLIGEAANGFESIAESLRRVETAPEKDVGRRNVNKGLFAGILGIVLGTGALVNHELEGDGQELVLRGDDIDEVVNHYLTSNDPGIHQFGERLGNATQGSDRYSVEFFDGWSDNDTVKVRRRGYLEDEFEPDNYGELLEEAETAL